MPKAFSAACDADPGDEHRRGRRGASGAALLVVIVQVTGKK